MERAAALTGAECEACGCTSNLQRDHVIPVSLGGSQHLTTSDGSVDAPTIAATTGLASGATGGPSNLYSPAASPRPAHPQKRDCRFQNFLPAPLFGGRAVSRRPRPPAPADLSEASAAAWPGLVSDLLATSGAAESDLMLLGNVLRACDRLMQIRAVLSADGPIVTESMGQVRPHPLLTAESTLRREIAAGFDALLLSPRHRGFHLEVSPTGRLRNS